MTAVIDKDDVGLNNGCQEDNGKIKNWEIKNEIEGKPFRGRKVPSGRKVTYHH